MYTFIFVYAAESIDITTLTTEASTSSTITSSLKSAMGRMKMQFVGTPHRADVDASNTLALFFGLVRRQKKIESFIENVRLV